MDFTLVAEVNPFDFGQNSDLGFTRSLPGKPGGGGSQSLREDRRAAQGLCFEDAGKTRGLKTLEKQ